MIRTRFMHILLIFAFLGEVLNAQETFYYCGNEKVIIKLQHEKKAVLFSSQLGNINFDTYLNLEKNKIDCDKYFLSIVNKNLLNENSKILNIPDDISVFFKAFPSYINKEGLELFPTGHIKIKLNQLSDYSILVKICNQFNCEILNQNNFMPLWFTVAVPLDCSYNPVELANTIFETGYFQSSIPDFYFDPLDICYDPNITQQWNLSNPRSNGIDINVSEAWNYATGRGVNVAIIDQGIELTHQDLADNIHSLSFDASNNSSPSGLYDSGYGNEMKSGHGTHCAGIIGAVRNNGVQITGIAPDASLMSISCNFNRSDIISQLADAINWAWQNGADIISCSWSCPEDNEIKESIDAALRYGRNGKGCIIVKSAGNTGHSITFPGNYREEIITVSNIDSDGILSDDSSYGNNLLVCAPGQKILSTVLDNKLEIKSGTSMACPHVSGVAALLLDRNPNLTAEQVREIIATNATKISTYTFQSQKKYGSWNEYIGYGLVNAFNSVINTPIGWH